MGLLLAVACLACDNRTSSARMEGRDHAAGSAAAEAYRIGAEPAVSIGVADGEEPYVLSYVQHAARLTDGRILVVTRGPDRRVRVFDADGRYLDGWGRSGGGPGEFATVPRSVHLDPDRRLVVPEALARRVSRFDLSGEFLDRVTLRYDPVVPREAVVHASACCELRAVLPDGSWLVEYPDHAPAEGRGVRRGEQVLVRFSAEGEWLGEFARLPGRLWRPGGRWDPGPLVYVPFSGYLAVAVIGEEVYVGNGVTYEVMVLDTEGRPLRALRLDREPPALGEELRDAFLDNVYNGLARSLEEREARRRTAAMGRRLPDRIAAYSQLLADPDGHLWLVPPLIPGAVDHARTATVLDADGGFVGEVVLPPRLRPFQIGRDWILGAVEDDRGVSRVVVHRIERRR